MMSTERYKRFLDPLVVSPLPDGKRWVLYERFDYYTYVRGKKEMVHVPKGFITDFASIPKIFCLFITYKDKYNKASVVHDYLCQHTNFTRKEADRAFLEAMGVVGINPIKKYIFYYAVRLYGILGLGKKKG